MREAMVSTLTNILKQDERSIILTADLGFQVFEKIEKDFPKQFLNVGICEANMIGIASGLAREGYSVFCYTMAPFVTLRCLEQIKIHMSIAKQDIKLLGVGAGYAYGHQGSSHHSIADYNVMHAMPNITVYSPSDPTEASFAIEMAYKLKCSSYIRLGFCYGKQVISKVDLKNTGINRVKKPTSKAKVAVLSMGTELIRINEAIVKKSNDYPLDIYSVLSIENLSEDDLVSQLSNYSAIITTEMNVSTGGLGEYLNSLLFRKKIFTIEVYNLHLPSEYYHMSGSEEYLLEQSGFSTEKLGIKIDEIVNKYS